MYNPAYLSSSCQSYSPSATEIDQIIGSDPFGLSGIGFWGSSNWHVALSSSSTTSYGSYGINPSDWNVLSPTGDGLEKSFGFSGMQPEAHSSIQAPPFNVSGSQYSSGNSTLFSPAPVAKTTTSTSPYINSYPQIQSYHPPAHEDSQTEYNDLDGEFYTCPICRAPIKNNFRTVDRHNTSERHNRKRLMEISRRLAVQCKKSARSIFDRLWKDYRTSVSTTCHNCGRKFYHGRIDTIKTHKKMCTTTHA